MALIDQNLIVTKRFGVMGDFSRNDCLYFDLDRLGTPDLKPIWEILRFLHIRPKWIRTDRSQKGWHVVVKHDHHLSRMEIVAIQALGGSDSKRELLNLMRAFNMDRSGLIDDFWKQRWNILFERKIL
jgi:hypothetical protein